MDSDTVVTQNQPETGGSVSTDNPTVTGTDDGATDESNVATEVQTETEPYYEKLGYKSWGELEEKHKRYENQARGSYAELERLRTQQAEQDRNYQQQLSILQNHILTSQTPKQEQEQPVTLAQALASWTEGDSGAMLQKYEQQQQSRTQTTGQNITPEQINQQVMQQLQTITRPAQYSDAIGNTHNELRDPNSEVYKRVFDEYDNFMAQRGGYYQFMLPNDPAAVRDVPGPDGFGTKKVDLRVANELAWKVKADIAREEGRKEEFNRNKRPGVSTQQAASKTVDAVDHWSMFSKAEQDSMMHLEAIGAGQEMGWPRDARAMAKYRFAKMPEGEQQRRKSMSGR